MKKPVTLIDPNETTFEATYREITGFAVLPGRAAKLFRLMASTPAGVTVFGTCEVSWATDRTVTITP